MTPETFTDPDIAALVAALSGTAPTALVDPAFQAACRAELLNAAHADMRYAGVMTPLGPIWVAFAGQTPLHLSARDEADFVAMVERAQGALPVKAVSVPPRLARQVQAAFAGKSTQPDMRALDRLTPFQRAVLLQARRIPRGEVRSYAWIARAIGHPNAVRAVGTALARNPLPFVIPCHRVIRSDGDLGRYSGGAAETKARILTLEGVDLPKLRDLAQAGLRYQGSRTTKIFCLPTCYTGKHMQDRNRVYFHTEAEARDKGYRPCKVCCPA
jgi:O-6-methylguanine DNA methyltransferase